MYNYSKMSENFKFILTIHFNTFLITHFANIFMIFILALLVIHGDDIFKNKAKIAPESSQNPRASRALKRALDPGRKRLRAPRS